MNIINFFRSRSMIFSGAFNLEEEENIFLYSPSLKTEDSIELLEPVGWQDHPPLTRTDSLLYISQFLSLVDEHPPLPALVQPHDPSPANNGTRRGIFSKGESVEPPSRQKKIKKLENSPFHNYQKHLNNALKKMVVVPSAEQSDEPYQQAAHQLWLRYLQSDIKTKKILHSVFNERNEHQSSEAELKTYGFWEVYQVYGEKTFNAAKNYLARLAIDQIDHPNIEGYLLTRKLKKRDGFKEYILQFRQELTNGFLKRRINLEQQN